MDLAGALRDRGFWGDVGNNVKDISQSASNTIAGNVSGPVDVLAWLLRKGGVPVGNAPMGGSDWMQQQGLTKPVQQSPASLAGDTLGLVSPMMTAAKAPEIASGLLKMGDNLAAPATMNPQAGMIRTSYGRIPETSKEIDGLADQLRDRGEALGHQVETGASNVSGSRYVTFKGADGPDYQVRLSNHGDRYPDQLAGQGERFSVDPDSGNTFEMAKKWLKDSGVNLSARVPKQSTAVIDDATLEKVVGQSVEKMQSMGTLDFWRNRFTLGKDGFWINKP